MRTVLRAALSLVLGSVLALSAAAPAGASAPEPTVRAVAAASAASSDAVTVPRDYIYKPKSGPHTKHPTLHDYCTMSPDSWGEANSRDPCARHDMCTEYKQVKRTTCDNNLRNDLIRNCNSAHPRKVLDLVKRTRCHEVALVYWAAVRLKTAIS